MRFRCYTAAMFAYLPLVDEGTRIAIDPIGRRAEAHRDGLGLALTYDVHRGCTRGDQDAAVKDVLALLRSFR